MRHRLTLCEDVDEGIDGEGERARGRTRLVSTNLSGSTDPSGD
jgi:hypothetical protein